MSPLCHRNIVINVNKVYTICTEYNVDCNQKSTLRQRWQLKRGIWFFAAEKRTIMFKMNSSLNTHFPVSGSIRCTRVCYSDYSPSLQAQQKMSYLIKKLFEALDLGS